MPQRFGAACREALTPPPDRSGGDLEMVGNRSVRSKLLQRKNDSAPQDDSVGSRRFSRLPRQATSCLTIEHQALKTCPSARLALSVHMPHFRNNTAIHGGSRPTIGPGVRFADDFCLL